MLLSFKQLLEAILPMSGKDSGYKDFHEIEHNGERYHSVVNYVHMHDHPNGPGHYKVIARVGKVDPATGTAKLGFKKISGMPKEVSAAIANHIGRSVSKFKTVHEWNGLYLGGTGIHTKEVYQNWGRKVVEKNPELVATEGNKYNPFSGAIAIKRREPISNPKLSGDNPTSHHSQYDTRGSYKRYKGESSGVSSGDIKKAKVSGDSMEVSSSSSAL